MAVGCRCVGVRARLREFGCLGEGTPEGSRWIPRSGCLGGGVAAGCGWVPGSGVRLHTLLSEVHFDTWANFRCHSRLGFWGAFAPFSPLPPFHLFSGELGFD